MTTEPQQLPPAEVVPLEYHAPDAGERAEAVDRSVDRVLKALGVLLLIAGLLAGVAMLCAAYLILLG